MSKTKFPLCGTCSLTMKDDAGNLFCRGGPPSCWRNADGTITSQFPPVGADKPGCALHPKFAPARRTAGKS